MRYCPNGEICSVRSDAVDREVFGGLCLGFEYCREAAERGLRRTCVYFDGTVAAEPPPDEGACPAAGDPGAPFCGDACGGCPVREAPYGWLGELFTSCIGRSPDRGFGLCTFDGMTTCRRGASTFADQCAGLVGQPCACLVFRGSDGELPDYGNTTFVDSCLAYRERYPDSVECFEPSEWRPLE